ncbi:MAG: hypothetical protein ACLR8Y_22630 [Alistipes indistinctus]
MKIREMQARLQQSRGYKWWVLGMIMLGTFMAVLDVTVVNVGIPTIMSRVPYPDFVGRMGHHRLYDYDDDYAAVGRLVGRPIRQQETLLRVEWLFLRWDRGSAGVREPTVS